MAEQHKRDDPLAGPLASSLRRGLQAPAGNCPDAESLAAYFDRSLAGEETARLELHFASCGRCQAQLAAMVGMEAAAKSPVAPAGFGLHFHPMWRWLAPAAAALGAVALWVVIRGPQSHVPSTGGPVLTTENKTRPAPSPEPSAAPPSPARAAGEEPPATTGPAAAEGAASRATGKIAEPLLVDKLAKADSAGRMGAPKMEPSPTRTASEPGIALVEKKAEPVSETVGAQEKQRAAEVQVTVTQQGEVARDEAVRPAEQPAVRQEEKATDSALLKRQRAPAATGAFSAEAVPPDSRFHEDRANTATIIDMANVTWAVVAAPNGTAYWRITRGGLIERSTDSGKTWQRQTSPVQAHLLAGSAPSPSVCWIVGKAGVVLLTTDGQTWRQLGSPTSLDIVAVEAKDAHIATVTTADGKRYSTTDAGRTWRSL